MITIMTPTYNRAYILNNAYNSLQNQTSFDFEWIIVDDGSKDGTEQLVSRWQDECRKFSIVYYKQPNGGKHRAVNRAVGLAKYEWFLILDSDDTLTATAVQKIHGWIKDIADKKEFAGVSGLCGFAGNSGAIGGKLNEEFIDATNLERKKYRLLGDKAEVYRTEILRKYPFPEFEGENFLRESAVWDRIAKNGFKLRWYNDIIYLCEYIEDGLTKNTNEKTYAENFSGFTYCSKLFVETHGGLSYLNKCGEFNRVSRMKGLKPKDSAKLLGANRIVYRAGIIFFSLKNILKKIRGS